MADAVTAVGWIDNDTPPSPLAERLPVDDADAASIAAFGVSESERRAIEKRALVYAHYLLRRRWRGIFCGTPPAATTAADLVQHAFAKLLSGDRTRPANIDLFRCLTEIIRSDVSHHAAKLENQESHAFLVVEGHHESPKRPVIDGADVRDVDASADGRLLAADLRNEISRHFADDPLMMQYVALRESERFETAAEYAAELKVPESKIYNMNRQLQRFHDRGRSTR